MSKVFSARHSVWLFWILATSISAMAGFLLATRFLNLAIDNYHIDLLNDPLNDLFIGAAFFALIGFPIGTGQWVILRFLHKRANLWIIATAIGIAVSFLLVFLGSSPVPMKFRAFYWLFSSMTAGMFIGTLQWVGLHRRLKGVAVWLLISGLSWEIAMSLVERMSDSLYLLKMDAIYIDIIFGASVGFVVGAISGAFVAHGLVHPDYSRANTT